MMHYIAPAGLDLKFELPLCFNEYQWPKSGIPGAVVAEIRYHLVISVTATADARLIAERRSLPLDGHTSAV